MTDTQPGTAQREFFAEVAAEFLQHYRRGPRFLAVTGVPESDPGRVADALAAALRDAGQETERADVTEGTTADAFRADVVAPFREREAVLVVAGRGLLGPDFRGFWNFSLWVEHDPERSPDWSFVTTGQKDPLGAPREVASVLLDDTDPERPRRLWADSC
ncbi:hypothetical protein [Leifsonia sp. 22587]|uniref:hypothetical protein n=1 Tax=Leifsonia sp. 22587 TaxID=3453946 RepID=UPI003F82D8FD